MKNVSKWLLAGSILAAAFACQSKKSQDESKQNPSQKECEYQSKVETTVSEPTVEAEKPCASDTPGEALTDAITVSDSTVEELNEAAAVNKDPISSPVAIESDSLPVPVLFTEASAPDLLENAVPAPECN